MSDLLIGWKLSGAGAVGAAMVVSGVGCGGAMVTEVSASLPLN